MTIEEKAWELIQRMSSAAGDLTMDLERYPNERYKLWCRDHRDVRDKIGAYADYLYCDANFQQDFLGDWTYEFSDDDAKRIELFEAIKQAEHNFTTACDRLINEIKKRMEKV